MVKRQLLDRLRVVAVFEQEKKIVGHIGPVHLARMIMIELLKEPIKVDDALELSVVRQRLKNGKKFLLV